MIGRDVVVEAEVVKQLSRCRLNADHRRLSRKSAGFNESRRYHNQSVSFSTVSAHCRRRLGFEPPQSIRGGHRGLRSYVRFGEAARPRLMATMGAERPAVFG